MLSSRITISIAFFSVLSAWLLCFLASLFRGTLSLAGHSISIEFLFLSLTFLLSISLALRGELWRFILILQAVWTAFFFLLAMPMIVVERAGASIPWTGWVYGICFLQLLGLFLGSPARRGGKGKKEISGREALSVGEVGESEEEIPGGLHSLWMWLFGAAVLSMPFVITLWASVGGKEGIGIRFSGAELLLGPMGLVALWHFARRRSVSVFGILISILSLSFVFSSLANLSFSSAAKGIQFLVAFSLPYAATRWVLRGRDGSKWVSNVLAGAALLAGGLALFQFAAGTPGYFVRAGFPDNRVYGIFVILVFPFLALRIWRGFRERPEIAFWAVGAVGVLFSVTLRDSGQLMAFLAGIGIFLLCMGRKKSKWLMIAALCAVTSLFHFDFHKDAAYRFIRVHEVADVAVAHDRALRLAAAKPAQLLRFKRGKSTFSLDAWCLPLVIPNLANLDIVFDEDILKQRYAEWSAGACMMGAFPALGAGPGNYQKRIGEYFSPLPKLNTSEPTMQNGWLVLGGSVGIVGMLALALALFAGIAKNAQFLRRVEVNVKGGERAFRAAVLSACAGFAIGAFWTPFFQAGTLWPLAILLALTADTVRFGNPKEAGFSALSIMKISHKWRILGLLFPLVALFITVPRIVQIETDNSVYLWREAENNALVTEPAKILTADGASRGIALVIPEGAGTGWRGEAGGGAAYEFEIPSDGVYRLWARTRWMDGCGNAFFVQFNEGRKLILGNDAVFGEWHWVKMGDRRLLQGPNRVAFTNREDGVKLDRMLLTNDLRFRPGGRISRFFDGFAGCDGNNSASWTPESGHWKVVSEPIEGLQDSFAQFGEGHAVALAGEVDWENYDLGLMVRASGGNAMGFFFNYLDEGNYDLLRWAAPDAALSYAGRIELVRRRQGEETVRDSSELALESGQWYELQKTVSGERDLILVDGAVVLSASTDPAGCGNIGLFSEGDPGVFFDNVTVDFH